MSPVVETFTLGERRELFVDDHRIADKKGVVRHIHPAIKYPANPVLRPDFSYEKSGGIFVNTVLRAEGGFRMWYAGRAEIKYGPTLHLYAESEDGIHWHKPILGLYEYEGSRENNIYLDRLAMKTGKPTPSHIVQDGTVSVIPTPHLNAPDKRFVALSFDTGGSGYVDHQGHVLAYSPDGLHWNDEPANPVLRDYADVSHFTWDPWGKRFLGTVKEFREVGGHRRRTAWITESQDLLHWSEPKCVFLPDEQDDAFSPDPRQHVQFYGLPIFPYESNYLGLLSIFRITDPDPAINHDGTHDSQLVSSRDGLNWERVGDRRDILQRGEVGSWDSGYVSPHNSVVTLTDEVLVYYSGTPCTHAKNRRIPGAYYIGLGHWRRDGFVSLDAMREGGEIITKPLLLQGSQLHVNADARGGMLRMGLLDSSGHAVPGFSPEDCLPIEHNALDVTVAWRDPIDLSALQEQPLQIRFVLHNARLYSYWASN